MCRVCNVVLSSEAMADSHYQGKQHRKKAREGGGNSCDSKSGANKQFFCEICQVQTTSEDMLKSHLAGKGHQKKVEQKDKPSGGFTCEVCNISTTDQNALDMHLVG